MPKETFTDTRAPIPEEVLRYLKRKKPVTSYSYQDVWAEEHALSFTVAKGMQLDVVRLIQEHLVAALKSGTGLDEFKKSLRPLLINKGWWGKRLTIDPKTGKVRPAQLGSARRLNLIWRVNMRSAYMVGKWEQSQRSESHPYLMYKLGPVRTKHRDEHASWAGTVLPKNDPWWQTHYPPLGYNCNCYVRLISKPSYERLKNKSGIRTTPLPDKMQFYVNKRTGAVRRLPRGVTPGFEVNQGAYGRSVPLALSLMDKALEMTDRPGMEKIMGEHLAHPIMRDAYAAFVATSLKKKKSTGRMVPIGMLADRYAKEVLLRGKESAGGLVALQERALVTKQQRHDRDGVGLTAEQWLMLPDVLQQPDRVYWDHKETNDTLLFTKQIEAGVLLLPIRFGKVFYGNKIDVVASAYVRPDLNYKRMDRQKKRYEKIE